MRKPGSGLKAVQLRGDDPILLTRRTVRCAASEPGGNYAYPAKRRHDLLASSLRPCRHMAVSFYRPAPAQWTCAVFIGTIATS